jgi:hypothetical protein
MRGPPGLRRSVPHRLARAQEGDAMPHQVIKSSAVGSIGDLAKITGVVKDLELNILAIGGGETVTDNGEVGVVSMIIEPDDPATTATLVDALRDLVLDDITDRHLADVEVLPNIHIALSNDVGELNRAAVAIDDINIRAILSLGDFLGESHVALGFAEGDVDEAERKLAEAGIKIVPHDEEAPSA